MVKRSTDQKLRLRNFDARNGRNETGAVIKNRKGMSGVEGGKGICYQWTEKNQCSKGDQCSFWHGSDDRAQEPDDNAATPSEPSLSRGRSVSKKRSIQGKSDHGAILQQPCRYYLKGTCTRSHCEWHPASANITKQKRAAKPGTSACSRIIRLMNNQTKSQRKATIPIKEVRATTRMLSVGFSKRQTVPRKPDAQSLGTDSKSRFTQSTLHQASIREKKGPSLGIIQVKHLHQCSPHAMKFEDPSYEETERQQRCARVKAWNLATSVHELDENDKATFDSPTEEWVLPATSTKELEERDFVVDSGATVHMVSKRDLHSAELETKRTSRSPTTVMTANGGVQTREEAIYVKVLDLIVTVMFLEETPADLSLGKLCEDHGYTYHWTSGQKTTTHPKKARESIGIHQTTMGAKMITKIILENNLICNLTNKKISGEKSCSGLATGNFENSKFLKGLVIVNKKTGQIKQKTKVHRIFLLFQTCCSCS